MSVPRHPVAILNPVAPGHGRALALLTRRAAEAGWPRVMVLHTTAEDPGAGQAQQALEQGADLVLVGGGDGTVRTVAQGLRGTGVTLGIIPLGTANIYARNLGLSPHRLDEAVRTAMLGRPEALDIGVARFRTEADPGQESGEHGFLVLAGLGHDALTVAATRPALKRRLGWLAYLEAGARHLVRRPLGMELSLDDGPAQYRQLWSCLVGNAPRIPLGIQVFPARTLADGLLDVMEVRVARPHHWAPVALAGLRRRAEARVLVHHDARTVQLRPDRPTALQLDGDVVGPVVEATLTVQPGALLVNRPSPAHRPDRRRKP